MTRAIRVIQLVFIALGLLCFLVMLGMFFFEGSRFSFTYSCDADTGACNGSTSDSPSGFDMGVALGLLGIGLEVAAVALGMLVLTAPRPTRSGSATGAMTAVSGTQPYPPTGGTGAAPGQQPFQAPQQYSQPPFPHGQMPGGHPG